jgi:glycine cleavage system H protein
MGQSIRWLRSAAIVLGYVVLVLLGLVLLPVVALAMRPLLILAILGSLVASQISPRFREWLEPAGEVYTSYNGLRFAMDVAAHPGHSWARIRRGEVTVGADDLVQATLGPVESVELPSVGTRVEQGDRLFSLRRGNRKVEVRAPVSGQVVTRNEALLSDPGLVNTKPFSGGWAVRLKADDLRKDRRILVEELRARRWFRYEIDRLMTTVLADDALAPALPDGGTLANEVYRHIDDGAWTKLTRTFFDLDETRVDQAHPMIH